MTTKELWIWYKDYWEKKFPDFTKSEFVLDKQGNITSLKVSRPGWKSSSGKTLKDAQYAYDNENGAQKTPAGPKTASLKVSLIKPKAKKEPKVFKTVACCIDEVKYNKVKELAKANNMSVHELLKNLLDQVIESNK